MTISAEMIFTGDELLRGDAVNTNQAFLGAELLDLGILCTRALSVTDDSAAISEAVRESLARRPSVLVLSGGLGPTKDDLTREAVADALGVSLLHHEDLLLQIREKFASRGYPMGESNRRQALLPAGAQPVPIAGTAPGFTIMHGSTLIAALPGVPWELETMWNGTVEPLVRSLVAPARGAGHVVRRIRTFGIGESSLADMISEFEWRGSLVDIGTRAKIDGLWVTLRAMDSAEGLAALEATQTRILEILGDRVLGVDGRGLPEIVGELLRGAGWSLGVAESCTGGLLGKRITDVPGSSEYFVGGVTSYANDIKTNLLGVSERLLQEHGAVSAEVAEAMAQGVAALLKTDCALSVTGVAGPDGGTVAKPVGLVYLGSVVAGSAQTERLTLFGRREQVRERAALSGLDFLRRRLLRARTNECAAEAPAL